MKPIDVQLGVAMDKVKDLEIRDVVVDVVKACQVIKNVNYAITQIKGELR